MPDNNNNDENQDSSNKAEANENNNGVNIHPIQAAWKEFISSVRLLLVPQPDDRPLDQYLEFRDSVLSLVESQKFLDALQNAWVETGFPPGAVHDALMLEIKTFPLAIEVFQATKKGRKASKKGLAKWLGRASTVAGSVRDILDNLPPWAKSGLTLLKELFDLFTPKD